MRADCCALPPPSMRGARAGFCRRSWLPDRVCVAATLIIPDSWLAKTNHLTASYAFWGLSNYFMMNYGDPYFAPRIDFNPSAHTWSLGVEEQFYWLYPLVFFSWLKLRTRTDAGRLIAHVMLAAVTLGSLVYSAYSRLVPGGRVLLAPQPFLGARGGALLFQFHATRTPTDRARGAQLWISFGLIAGRPRVQSRSVLPGALGAGGGAGTAGAIDAAVMAGAHGPCACCPRRCRCGSARARTPCTVALAGVRAVSLDGGPREPRHADRGGGADCGAR